MNPATKGGQEAAEYIEAAMLRRVPPPSLVRSVASQFRLDQRSLALHSLAATKLERDPTLLKRKVYPTLERFLAAHAGTGTVRLLAVWKAAIAAGLPQVLQLCRDTSDRANQLRQASPVVTLLTPKERREIYDAYATRAPD